jgi:hypothetical protein
VDAPLGCIPKSLPPHLQFEAAWRSVLANADNLPRLAAGHLVMAEAPQIPGEMAIARGKYWPNGSKVAVEFWGGSTEVQDRVMAHANAWSAYANLDFLAVNRGRGQIRVSFDQPGYWSYIGTDCLSVSPGEPTLNLQGFDQLNMPESEWHRVVRHEVGHCLAGDMLIDCPRDLEKYPQGVPIRELVGQRPWVYGWKDGRPVIRRASRVWLTKEGAATVRVRLKTGQGGKKSRTYLPPLELVGTPDHPVLLADGKTWKPLGQLRRGDRLCSLYRQKNGSRSVITWTGTKDRVREHVFVCGQVYGPRPEGHHAHHKNGRMLDQSPENLEWKDAFAHLSDHSRGHPVGEEQKAKLVAYWTGRKHTADARAKMSAAQLGRPPLSAETRAKLSAASSGRPQSPEQLEKKRQAMLRFYAAGNRSGMYGKTASPETRARQSAAIKASHARKAAERQAANNHVVVSVEPGEPQAVYDMTVPDADSFVANGVVVHNSLGALHEQQRPEVVARLDPAKVIAAFQRSQGWSEQEIRDQILTPFDLSATEHTDEDDRSIMMYFFDGSLTVDGQPIVGGSDIDDRDKLLISQVYPGRWTPGTTPPVTPPAPPPDLPAIVVGDENGVRGTIPRGKSARFLLHKDKAVPLTIEAVVRGAGSRKPIVRMGLPGGASTLLKLTGSEARNVKAPVGDYEVRVSHPIAGHSGPCWVAARYS